MMAKGQVVAGVLAAGACVLSVFAAAGPGVWLDVPYVRQAPEGCGAACISMVMKYWAKDAGHDAGDDADPDKIQAQLFDPKAGGIKASAMETYFRLKGFRTYTFQGRWSDLSQHLSKGRPLIVCLREGGALAHSLHYVVVAGIDTENNIVMLNDPAGRKLGKFDRARFEKRWAAMDDWTLLALPEHEP